MKRIATIYLDTILLVIASLLSIAAIVYFLSADLSNANGDTVARLNISRRVIDSATPGFAQLGYVWLPATSIAMLPFVWFDSLYYSGLAGIIPSALSFIFAALFIFKIGEFLVNRYAGLIAYTLFVLNPNVLYVQSTALSEIFYVCMILGALLYALRWARFQRDGYLIASSVFFFGATLSRYDGWFMAILTLFGVSLFVIATLRDWRKMEATAIIFGVLAFLGPVLWLIWNFSIFDNPFYFAVGEYSAQHQQRELMDTGMLPSYHNISNSFLHIFYSAQMTVGWGMLVLGTLALIAIVWRIVSKGQLRYIFLAVLFGQVIYYFINLFTGSGVIYVPQLYPHKMHNIRYAITFLPFFAIASAILIARWPKVATLAVAFILFEYASMSSSGNIITLRESVEGFSGKEAHATRIAAGEWLEDHYDSGAVLVDIFNNDSAAFHSQIPLKNWITVGDPDAFYTATQNPAKNVSWVFVREYDKLYWTFDGGKKLESDFQCVYREGDVKIYKAKDRLVSSERFYACDTALTARAETTTNQ